jgi:DNA polymerase/3'-5' exonuclease PolX/predicted flap endonuclease-1-like 5' DNA nuclease
MKQLFDKIIQLIQELIDIRYQQSNLFIKLDKKKESTAIQFKIKNYIKWKDIIHLHIKNNTEIKNISDIKNLKLTEKLDAKLCELFDTGDIKDIDEAKIELIELETQYKSKFDTTTANNSLSNSIVSMDSSIDDSEEQDKKEQDLGKELTKNNTNIQSKKVKVEKAEKAEKASKDSKDSKDSKLNTTKLESIPKNMMSITRPTDERGGSIYDLQLLHGIGEKSAIQLYEKGVTLEGLINEWIQWIEKNPMNSILLPQQMERPKEYTQSKWDSLEVWKRNSILETNFKKKIETETKLLCKIHRDTLVGLKYFHDMTQKIPREEIQKAETILNRVAEYMNKDLKVILCGSYRRGRDKSGDIDCCILHPDIKTQEDIKTNQYNILANFVEMLINVGFIIDQLDMGLQKFMGLCMIKQTNKKTNVARRLDIRFMPYESYGSAILYFTGSANFNTNIRKIALNKGYSLSEFGFKKKNDGILIPCATEEEVFRFLDLPYKTPKERDI